MRQNLILVTMFLFFSSTLAKMYLAETEGIIINKKQVLHCSLIKLCLVQGVPRNMTVERQIEGRLCGIDS